MFFVFLVIFVAIVAFVVSRIRRANLPSSSSIHLHSDYIQETALTTTSESSACAPEEASRPPVGPVSSPSSIAALLPRHFVVFDLETTGLIPHRHEIIEFGAILIDLNSNEHLTFQSLVRPERRLSRKISEITGITQQMVDKDGQPLGEVLSQFMEFIGDLPLVAFNAEFDMGFLRSAAQKHGIAVKNRYTCALKRARRAWPGLDSYRLADLARHGKLSEADSHRALSDSVRAMHIFVAATVQLGQKVRWTKAEIEPASLTASTIR